MSEDFTDLPDLAAEGVRGAAIACNDEFFAEKENLLKPGDAVWKDHLYTDKGKWMDGWETRRRREPGHDWCVIRLGMPGTIHGVVVDTAWFRGNFPESCRLSAATIGGAAGTTDDALDLAQLDAATWVELLPQTKLAGDTKNKFRIDAKHHHQRFTHVKLEIFPDGGVARLRIHGVVTPDWGKLRALGGPIDLAALENGAVVQTCSDMFFGSRNNLIKPGPSLSMADGWETRRRRGPGNDWAIVRLAAAGTLERVELDTTHFKGNAPGRIELEGRHGDGDWRLLVATPVQPHTRHFFDDALRRVGAITHLRVNVFPCGGIARLRAWGNLERLEAAVPVLATLGAAEYKRCCAATRWVDAMVAHHGFDDLATLLRTAERTWWRLGEADFLEAFAGHPKIGEAKVSSTGDATWSRGEQRAAEGAAPDTTEELAELNRRYVEAHGFIFITCASGRSAAAMLAELRARVDRPRADELRTAAEEQIKITRLRLTRLVAELGGQP
ncbi:MAG: allantoicase [Proteobacteria bacterium]|nr:allantoicase [Pseudomonadota bacterium]